MTLSHGFFFSLRAGLCPSVTTHLTEIHEASPTVRAHSPPPTLTAPQSVRSHRSSQQQRMPSSRFQRFTDLKEYTAGLILVHGP
ncbi:hypothetical protein CC85DRAFT_286251 [Cutaneotrichosporon oleaginosum]|uniref:Uncharacterized protein n=1 Tax=Cutaneotrichosporon oleaginosum TaxID=879819 RepID=A0A0J0XKV9_9TREE|nr:uncharacterized protein CC85DRAFT_286251 [Cutaneotrichosporon oleaginosum]KLT41715.1 hypothetical protein CC85DRAFT_286251 [Cutaneotrichosporon oleaginosum]TXT08087.1 hypothetical protein COLE_05011 [Cutaneotrichosporon oleaginosum]